MTDDANVSTSHPSEEAEVDPDGGEPSTDEPSTDEPLVERLRASLVEHFSEAEIEAARAEVEALNERLSENAGTATRDPPA